MCTADRSYPAFIHKMHRSPPSLPRLNLGETHLVWGWCKLFYLGIGGDGVDGVDNAV